MHLNDPQGLFIGFAATFAPFAPAIDLLYNHQIPYTDAPAALYELVNFPPSYAAVTAFFDTSESATANMKSSDIFMAKPANHSLPWLSTSYSALSGGLPTTYNGLVNYLRISGETYLQRQLRELQAKQGILRPWSQW